MNKIIGIAGGSGSGKSTLAVSLCKEYPEIFTVVHVDDYFKKKEDAPQLNDFTNWDHPDALRLDDLYNDLLALKQGESVTLLTKGELYNPDYSSELRNKIEHTIQPKPVIILEGYLALYDPKIRSLLDTKIFLDIPVEVSTKRRSGNKFDLGEEYFKNVLLPMFEEFVAPTRAYADLLIDVSNKSAEEVFQIIKNYLNKLSYLSA